MGVTQDERKLDREVERYREAAEAARETASLGVISYLHGIRKGQLATALNQNRVQVVEAQFNR